MKNLEFINKFFEIENNENFGNEIFNALKSVINFQSGYIYFSDKPEYSYGECDGKLRLENNLKIKNTIFGKIVLTADKFSKNDKETFTVCSVIISNLIKDNEISKIMKMQTQALQQGYLEIKEAELAKTNFISHFSHELRTPLNSILGFSDLLKIVGELNPKQTEYVNDIKVAGLHLLGMINEILDMSKFEADAIKLTIKNFEINQVITEVVNIIEPLLIQKKIKLVQKIENYNINADYQKFQQILFNLLSNAIKFTPENGTITIQTKVTKNYNIVTVKDNGIGIAEKDLNKIFDKFEQLDKNHNNSTGLGLFITKELVKLHDGEISVKSKLNKGSEFIIKISKTS